MTVSSTTNRASASGNGATTAFSTGFYFLSAADLRVSVLDSDGVETVKTITTHYTVVGEGEAAGGTVTFLTAPASGETVLIVRDPSLLQPLDFSDNPRYSPASVEKHFDRIAMQLQRTGERIDRTIQLPTSSTAQSDVGDVETRADMLVGFDSDGDVALFTRGGAVGTGEIGTTQLADGAVTAAKLANMAQATIKGRASGAGTGVPVDLTATQVRTILNIDGTLDADKPLSTPMLSRLAQYETTVHRLCDEDDPSLITAADIETALAADTDIKCVQFLGYEYAFDNVTVANRDMMFLGKGSGATKIDFSGTDGGLTFTDSSTSLTGAKTFGVAGITFTTDDTTFRAIDARWAPRPYFFDGNMATFEDITGITKNIAAAQAWTEIIYCENAQGVSAHRINGSNRRDNESGKAIRLKTCLGGARLSDLNLNYFDDAVYCEPTPFSIVNLSSVSGTFEAGDVVTTSGGATGMLMRDLTSSNFAIIPISGSFTVSHTVTGSISGATGTIASVDNTRHWAGEGLWVRDIETVGVKRGVNVYNPNAVYQKFVGVFLSGIHANAKEYGINLEYATQVEATDALLYHLANNAIGYRLVGTDKARISGRVQDPTGYTSTVGIVISVGTAGYSTDTADEIRYRIDFDNCDTDESIDPAATNIYKIYEDRIDASDWVAWTPTVSAQTGTITAVGTVTARYRQRGKTVSIQASITITTAGTATNDLRFTLPSGMTLKTNTSIPGQENNVTGKAIYAREAAAASILGCRYYDGSVIFADGCRVDITGTFEIE